MTYIYTYETINTVIIFIHKNFLMFLGNPSPNLHLKSRQPLTCFLSPEISLLSVEFSINMYSSFFLFWSGAGAQMLTYVRLSATPWTVAHQALCPWGFSRQEYWNGLPCPPLGDLPNPGMNLRLLHFLHWQADSLLTNATCEALLLSNSIITLLVGMQTSTATMENSVEIY